MVTENEILEYLDKNIILVKDENTGRNYINSNDPIIQNQIILGGLDCVIFIKFNHSFFSITHSKSIKKWIKRNKTILIKNNTPCVAPFYHKKIMK